MRARDYLADLQQALESNQVNVLDVVRILAEPLDYLALLPRDSDYQAWQGPGSHPPSVAERMDLLKSTAWRGFVKTVAVQVIQDWGPALTATQRKDLLEPYVRGRSSSSPDASITEVSAATRTFSVFALNDCLVGAANLHSLTIEFIVENFDFILDKSSISSFHHAIFRCQQGCNVALCPAMATWKSFVLALTTLPTRIANQVGIHDYQRPNTRSRFPDDRAQARRLALQSCTALLNQSPLTSPHLCEALGCLIERLFVSGYADQVTETVYSAIAHQVCDAHVAQALANFAPGWQVILENNLGSYHDMSKFISHTIKLATSRIRDGANKSMTVASEAALGIHGETVLEDELSISSGQKITISKEVDILLVVLGFLGSDTGNATARRKTRDVILRSILMGDKAGCNLLTSRVTVAAIVRSMSQSESTTANHNSAKRSVSSPAELIDMLQELLSLWGSSDFVKHALWKQQLYVSATILLALGYIEPDALRKSALSSKAIQAVQPWLENPEIRVRKLGIMLAETFSAIVDPPDMQLHFDILTEKEDQLYFSLRNFINAEDAWAVAIHGGEESEAPLGEELEATSNRELSSSDDSRGKYDANEGDDLLDPDAPFIFESQEDADSDDLDLEPYAMNEESDDERNIVEGQVMPPKKKIIPPRFLADLISYLKASDDPNKIEVGISSAAELLRQKASMNYEIQENAVELAKTLVSISNQYDLDGFDEHKQAALVSLTVACPEIVAKLLATEFHSQGYALTQRSSMLSALAASAKELSSIAENDDVLIQALPSEPPSIKALNTSIQQTIAIDSAPEPKGSALDMVSEKTRYFRKSKPKPMHASYRSRFSKLMADAFYWPLAQGWLEGVHGAWSDKSYVAVASDPALLEQFVLTLTIFVYCGVSSSQASKVIYDFWSFVLSLRYSPLITTRNVLIAILSAMNVVINSGIISERRLVEEFGRELLTTKEWTEGVFERNQDPQVQMLVASILIKLRDVSQEYERLLMGDLLPI